VEERDGEGDVEKGIKVERKENKRDYPSV